VHVCCFSIKPFLISGKKIKEKEGENGILEFFSAGDKVEEG